MTDTRTQSQGPYSNKSGSFSPKSEHQQRIEEFMRRINCTLPDKPTVPDEVVRAKRAKFIMKETIETIAALGFSVTVGSIGVRFSHIYDCDMVAVADGCADLSVCVIGTLSAFGISDTPILEEVDRSNLTKVAPPSQRDAKAVKSDGYNRLNFKNY